MEGERTRSPAKVPQELPSHHMRIGFDASPLSHPHPRGIQRVVKRSLEALEERGQLEVVRLVPPAGSDLRRWRQRDLPRAASQLAGVHSFLSAFPWRGPGLRVQTIHELPWLHGASENAGWRHRLWARIGPYRSDAVVTATERTAYDLGIRRHAEGGKLFVVPWGVEERFTEEPPPGVVDETLLSTYRLSEGPFVLALGAVRAKKNLAAALQGLATLKEAGGTVPQLVVTGGDTPDLRRSLGLAQKLGVTRHVSTLDHLEEEHLPGVLRLASAVVVLSRSEGFSLPVLEAAACGTPAVVPRDSAQAEVAGPLAFLVDPDQPTSVAEGLREAIERREELRYLLPQHTKDLTWSRTAEGIESVWEALA